jgi:hypothetical protein
MLWILSRQVPFLFRQNLFIASKPPHNFLSSYCSQLVRIDAVENFDAGVSDSKPLSFETVMILSLDLGADSSVLPNFKKVVES